MSVSTTGFVLTETKDIPIFRDTTSKFPTIECNPSNKFFNIYFKVNNESRMLTVHFNCDSDYSEYGNSKIIWGVNYWGMSEEIVLMR